MRDTLWHRMQITGRRRTLAQAPAQRQQSASLGATVWLRPPYSSGSYASLACQLGMSNASTIGSPVHIQGVQGLSKLGIGGNGKCEIGELPGPSNIGEILLHQNVSQTLCKSLQTRKL